MKKEIIIYSMVIGFFGAILISCMHDLPNANDMPKVCFNSDVLPVFQSSCAISGCHDSRTAEAGLIFDNYNSIMQSVSAGDPKNSEAYQVIIAKWFNAMPPDKPISKDARTLIRIWIEQGALNLDCSSTIAITTDPDLTEKSTCFSRDILPIMSSSCAVTGCHDNVTHEEGFRFTSYALLKSYSGMIVPGNAANSKFYKVMVSIGDKKMPPSPRSLTTSQISLIAKWINEGAADNTCVSVCDTATYTYSEAIDKIIVNNCKGCHSVASATNKNVTLNSFNDVKTIALDGRLVNVINALAGKPQMPPSQKLSSCNIAQIEKWVKAGTLNN